MNRVMVVLLVLALLVPCTAFAQNDEPGSKDYPAITRMPYVVGHTDMVGDAATNMKLSQARAESVVKDLASKYQVPSTRMVPFGAGPYSPVASNKTEEGRAKNRRVELVEIATR